MNTQLKRTGLKVVYALLTLLILGILLLWYGFHTALHPSPSRSTKDYTYTDPLTRKMVFSFRYPDNLHDDPSVSENNSGSISLISSSFVEGPAVQISIHVIPATDSDYAYFKNKSGYSPQQFGSHTFLIRANSADFQGVASNDREAILFNDNYLIATDYTTYDQAYINTIFSSVQF